MKQRILSRGRGSLTQYLDQIPAYSPPAVQTKPGTGRELDRTTYLEPEELVLSNLLFVVKIAGEYRNRGVPLEDLLNEGNIGLMHAASRYDPGRGVKFTSYAAWWIRKSIRTALYEQGSTIRVPDYQRRKVARLKAEDETSRASHGHLASDPRCADCGPPPPASGLHRVSLNDSARTRDDHRGPLIDLMADQRSVDPMREMISQEDLAGLERGLSTLSRKEREVLIGRFGLAGEGSQTLKEIGVTLGLSRERIRQIEAEAKGKLRAHLSRTAERPTRRQVG